MPVSYQNLNEADLKDPRGVNINKRNRELVNEVNRLGGLNGPVAILNGIVVGQNGSGSITGAKAILSGAVQAASGAISGTLSAGSIATTGPVAAGAVTAASVTSAGAVVAGSITLGTGTSTVQIIVGSGAPDGVVAAPVGSLFLNVGPSGANTLYVKQSGMATNQGWVGK
jgi:hypothetical protein